MGGILQLDEQTFSQEVLHASMVVVVDFWAQWCGPCKRIAPLLEEIARDYAGKIKIVKVDVDECPSLASRLNIMSIPTLLFFKEGKERDRITGAVAKEVIVDKCVELQG